MVSKTKVKKIIKKAAPAIAKKTPAGILAKVAAKAGKAVAGKVTTVAAAKRAGRGFRRRRTARQLLKKAYERRALRQIRTGDLGQARRTLRKKATVI